MKMVKIGVYAVLVTICLLFNHVQNKQVRFPLETDADVGGQQRKRGIYKFEAQHEELRLPGRQLKKVINLKEVMSECYNETTKRNCVNGCWYNSLDDECLDDEFFPQQNSRPALVSDYPYMLSVQVHRENTPYCEEHLCGAVLVRDDVAITAASCIQGLLNLKLRFKKSPSTSNFTEKVSVVRQSKCRNQNGVETVKAQMAIIHPNFESSKGGSNDIALIILENNMTTSKFMDFESSHLYETNEVENAKFLGYGYKFEGDNQFDSRSLKVETVNVSTNDDCSNMLRAFDVDQDLFNQTTMLCVWGSKISICRGDGGGPVFVQEGDDAILLGISSFSFSQERCGAAEQPPNVFTKISAYSDWITEQITAYSKSGFIIPSSPITPSPSPRSPISPTLAPTPIPVPSPLMPPVAQQGVCNYQAYSFSTPGVCKENTAIQLQAAEGVVVDPPGYMISIQVPKKDIEDPNWGPCYKHECGGSLIAPNLVLTAGHCIAKHSGWINEDGNINSLIEIYAARAPICRHETGSGRIGVIKVFMHPEYDMEVYNDVAVLELLGAFDGPYINYQQAYKLMLKEHQELYLMGYGLQYAFDGGYKRLPFVQLTMNYMPDKSCNSALGPNVAHAFVDENMLCAYPFEGATCQGDSGSPLVLRTDDNEDVVVGINSWGNNGKCGQTKSTVFAEIGSPNITLWIDKIVQTYGTVHGSVQWTKPQPLTD